MPSISQLTEFREPLVIARNTGHRLMLVLAMEEERGLIQAQHLSQLGGSCLWVDVLKDDHSHSKQQRYITSTQAKQYLGTSNQHVVYNAHRAFNASALCAVSGTIRGGGVLILLTPPSAQWHKNYDLQLESYGHSINTAHSHFIQWWQKQWQHHSAVFVLQEPHAEPQHKVVPINWQPLPLIFEASQPLQPTEAQGHLISQLVMAYEQQNSMVLTIDARRGRGKSACLGWFIKALGSKARHGPAIVTAPSKRSLNAMMQTSAMPSINFYALDALLTSLPDAGVLIVDEAAAIPLSQLIKLIKVYKLVVLSSTQDGYEGSGQGYRLKLPHIIASLGRSSKHMTLTQPMRWQAGDALENFIRSSFLCDVELPNITHNAFADSSMALTYSQVTGAKLAQNQTLLRQVYGLLMLAHYQTTPQDLRLLLDHPQHQMHLCFVGEHLVGLAWVAEEGNLDASLARQIALGQRRIQGHLLAQILSQQAGFSVACELSSWRIQRLVVTPSLQGRGIGSKLLQRVYGLAQERQVDFVGASFSASSKNLDFWQLNKFIPIWLGVRADTATGFNSVQVMQPISADAKILQDQLRCHFRDYLTFGQHLWFSSIDADLWQIIFSSCQKNVMVALSKKQQQNLLTLLANGRAGFSGPLYLLHQNVRDAKHKSMIIQAAQNNTHKGLQEHVRRLAQTTLALLHGV